MAIETTAQVERPPAGASSGELVRWAFAVLNTHDVAPLRTFWEGAVEYFPGLTCHGPDEIGAYFRTVFAAVPDARIEIEGFAEQGEDVFVRWRLSGRFTGAPFHGIAATGGAVELAGTDHFVIRDGRVATNHVVYDQMEFARQIGMLPRDGTVADRALKGMFNARTGLVAKLRKR